MKIRQQASQFSVLVVASDPSWGGEAKTELSRAGYDAHLLVEGTPLEDRLQQLNPHILIFSVLELTDTLSEFIQDVAKINPEIRFVILGDPAHFDSLSFYVDYGFEQFISTQKENLGLRITAAVDRICEKLYLTYQNEQLLEEVQDKRNDPSVISSANSLTGSSAPLGPSLSSRIATYQTSSSREVLIQSFFDLVGVPPLIYFRFLSSVTSFMAIQASGVDSKALNGVGCQVDGLSLKDLSTQLTLGVVPAPLLEVVQKNFKIQNPRLHPLFSHGQLDGLIVYSADLEAQKKAFLQEELSLFSLVHAFMDLQKRVELLEVQDPVTEVFNRKFYEGRLSEEVGRSLRIRQPISLIKISVDDFFEIEQTLGEAGRDLILKKVAQLVLKSNRTSDVVARTAQNEISVLLPHSHRQGAMIRAERIRRVIENSLTLESGVRVSVSLGISEYPSLCKSAEHLEESATKALTHISGRGGNRICLFKAPPEHLPEFEVRLEPG